MAMTATIIAVRRSDQTIDVDVVYEDTARVPTFNQPRAFNFALPITPLEIRNEVRAVGIRYRDALNSQETVLGNITLPFVINIPATGN